MSIKTQGLLAFLMLHPKTRFLIDFKDETALTVQSELKKRPLCLGFSHFS